MRGKREEQVCGHQDEEGGGGGGLGVRGDSLQPVEKFRRKSPSLSPWGSVVEQIFTLQPVETPCHSKARALKETAAQRQPMERSPC